MAVISPYLNFEGTTEEAFNFYKSVFGGEFTALQRYKDVPASPESKPLTKDELEKIMHVSLPISNGVVLMATDAIESMGWKLSVGNNVALSVSAESKAEADKIFNGLSAGGSVSMPMTDTFWGAYFGMFEDKFGIKWMVNYDYPKN